MGRLYLCTASEVRAFLRHPMSILHNGGAHYIYTISHWEAELRRGWSYQRSCPRAARSTALHLFATPGLLRVEFRERVALIPKCTYESPC